VVTNELRSARAEKRMTQAEVARFIGVSRQTIAAIEAGASVPSVEIALRLARTLGRPVEGLFRLRAGTRAGSRALIIAGSDDPGLALLVDRLRRGAGPLLSLSALGSAVGLEQIASGSADIAGIHLDDNLGRARETVAAPALIHFARREQGLVMRTGVRVNGLDELAGLRLILRSQGSGTRALFEREVNQFSGRVVAEAPSHDQVAAAVLRGDADVGTALHATARRYGLRFFPLAWERFDLVLERTLLSDERVERLVSALSDPEHRGAVEALGGYDLSESGRVVSVT
jgi:molybdate-binding protein/DNA-binding XRE family transcriptional regulator